MGDFGEGSGALYQGAEHIPGTGLVKLEEG